MLSMKGFCWVAKPSDLWFHCILSEAPPGFQARECKSLGCKGPCHWSVEHSFPMDESLVEVVKHPLVVGLWIQHDCDSNKAPKGYNLKYPRETIILLPTFISIWDHCNYHCLSLTVPLVFCHNQGIKYPGLTCGLLFRIFGRFCEKKADSIGFRAYASS